MKEHDGHKEGGVTVSEVEAAVERAVFRVVPAAIDKAIAVAVPAAVDAAFERGKPGIVQTASKGAADQMKSVLERIELRWANYDGMLATARETTTRRTQELIERIEARTRALRVRTRWLDRQTNAIRPRLTKDLE